MRSDDVILDIQEMKHEFMNQDPLKECVIKSLYKEDLDGEKLNLNAELTETMLSLSEGSEETLRRSDIKMKEVEKSSEWLFLKQLPKHLKYSFLGEDESKPVIIAVDLTLEKG